MTTFIALVRAVNLGGTNKLPMAELTAMCEAEGFGRVRTYIASGNVVFTSDGDEAGIKAALEVRLAAYAGRPLGVCVRTGPEMAAVLAANPFRDAPPNRTVAIFLDAPPPADALAHVTRQTSERVGLGAREIYVAYPDGPSMARSRLAIPAAAHGTARNLNTVAKLAQMAGAE